MKIILEHAWTIGQIGCVVALLGGAYFSFMETELCRKLFGKKPRLANFSNQITEAQSSPEGVDLVRVRSATPVYHERSQRVNFITTNFHSKSTLFSLGIVVGILSFWGALSIGEGSQSGNYVRTLPAAVLAAENVTITSSPTHSGASIRVWKGDTDSSLNNYQLERDACCPGQGAE